MNSINGIPEPTQTESFEAVAQAAISGVMNDTFNAAYSEWNAKEGGEIASEAVVNAYKAILTAHRADRQAYALEVLEGLLTKAEIHAADGAWVYVGVIKEAIQKINQDLGREV